MIEGLENIITSDGENLCNSFHSENKVYSIYWSLNNPTDKKDSPIYFFKDGKELFKKKFIRPRKCKVGNIGKYIIFELPKPDELLSDIYIYDEKGDNLKKFRFKAIVLRMWLSYSGKYLLILNGKNADHKDGDQLSLISLDKLDFIWKNKTPFYPNKVDFYEEYNYLEIFSDDFYHISSKFKLEYNENIGSLE